MHQSKHSSTTSVVNSENKKLSKSISSTITSSSTTSSYSSDSSQLNNDKQTKTFLKRFQKLLIHSIRKSSPLIKNSNTIQVNNNDYNEQLTMKDSIRTKYHPCMNDHKKRSKSLRVISNCLHSVTASQCSLQNNSSKYENKVCNHCLQYNKHVDKSPFLNLVNTKKQHNVHNNSDSNMNSSKYLINTSSKHIRKLLTCHDYSIVSKAVEKFISSLNQALVHLFNKSTTTNTTASNLCNPSHQSYDSFKQILIELVIVLQCKQFIKDFVKCEGHCKLFQLVEIIDKVDKSFHDEIWTHLLACLVELSKHAITNQLPNDNDATIVDNNSSHKDSFYPQEDFCFTLNNDDYIMHSSDEITILKHDNEKVDDQTIKYSPTILPRSIHATEFFSWQLVSDQFLSVIIEHCRKETKLDCLLNEMKLLLKITNDYPVHIPYVIKQTGQGFILDLLKIIQLNITGPKSSTNSNSVHSEMLRCEIQNLIMKFLYVIFYYGKQQGRLVCLIHQFLENVQFIEWIPELRNQSLWKSMVTSYYPKKHQSDYSMTTLNPFSLFVNDASDENAENKFVLKYLEDFSNFLENDSCCKTEYNNNNNNMIIYGSSNDNVGQQQRQCNSSHRLANDSIHATFNNDSSNKQSSIHLLSSLCRVQQIANSLLVTRMNTPLDPTSEENIEKMNQLCSAVYFDEYANNPTVEAIEEACIKLGFTIPTDPYADFKKPPGLLGFQCIYFYIMKNRTKLTDMLNYAYPRQKQAYSPTNYCKLNYLSEFNLSSSSNVNSNFDARGNSQRIQRHFSTVDSNHMQKMLLHTSPGVQHQQQRNNNTGRRFTVDSLTPANLPQSFNKPNRECNSSSQSFLYNYSIPSSTSSTSTISYIDKKPLFPIIEAANAVTNMLYELITTSDTIHEPYSIIEQDDKDFYLPSLFYPILLSHNNQFNNSTFENLFDCVFSIFFYSWTQMKAVPEDLIAVS
ncbi:Engulfment and cell motility 2 [Schistosoma japonicum]|nr:Engulfment and cell motility 2 [Schistosoma japonicum]